ncbi:unnamed protein product, partial [marine sediment metagenome]
MEKSWYPADLTQKPIITCVLCLRKKELQSHVFAVIWSAVTVLLHFKASTRLMHSKKIMDIVYKEYKHNPPHLFSPNSKYFITGATYKKKMGFKSNKAKERLLESIIIGFNQHGWFLEGWVILDNHYHLLANAPDNCNNLPEMMKDIHKFVALWIKKNIP